MSDQCEHPHAHLAMDLRSRFLAYVSDQLPGTLSAQAATHYRARVQRHGEGPMLGELAPFIVADLAARPLPNPTDPAIIAYLTTYAAVVLQDEIFDGQVADKDRNLLSLAVLALMQAGSLELARLVPDLPQKPFRDAAGAAEREMVASSCRELQTFTMGGLLAAGDKNALLDVLPYVLGGCGEGMLDSLRELRAAFQLLDDRNDIQEDFTEGSPTPLLVRIEGLIKEANPRLAFGPRRISGAGIVLLATHLGVMDEALLWAGRLMGMALERLPGAAATPSVRYVRATMEEMAGLRAESGECPQRAMATLRGANLWSDTQYGVVFVSAAKYKESRSDLSGRT